MTIIVRNCKVPVINQHKRMQVDAFGKIEESKDRTVTEVKLDKDFSAEVFDNFQNQKGVQSMHNYDGKSSIGDTSSFNASSYYGNRNNFGGNRYGGNNNYGNNNYGNNNYGNNNYGNSYNYGGSYNNYGNRPNNNQRQVGTLGGTSVNDASSMGTGNNLSLFSS